MKSSIGIGLVILGIVALVFVPLGFRYFMAAPRGMVDAEVQIQSGSSRIVNYNHFFDLCASIQANETALDAQFSSLETAKGQTQIDRINTNVSALKTNRSRSIQQYNADARKEYTQGQFRSSDLPYEIPDVVYDQENRMKTSCHS